ncbi:MAG: LytTR family DNA-binding domain-containing protein [Lachnospiraceae bacterium]
MNSVYKYKYGLGVYVKGDYMLKIAICDDNQVCRNKMQALLAKYEMDHKMTYEVFEYAGASDLLNSNVEGLNLIFLDVEMLEENGISLGKQIRVRNKEAAIIYVSEYVQYAPQGYQVKASAYILKHDLDSLFEETLTTILEDMNIEDEYFDILDKGQKIRVLIKNIIFVEIYSKSVLIHMEIGSDEIYEMKVALHVLEQELHAKGFLRIHKSYLVNMGHILAMRNYQVHLSTGRSLSASQRKWSDLVKEFVDWKGRSVWNM